MRWLSGQKAIGRNGPRRLPPADGSPAAGTHGRRAVADEDAAAFVRWVDRDQGLADVHHVAQAGVQHAASVLHGNLDDSLRGRAVKSRSGVAGGGFL